MNYSVGIYLLFFHISLVLLEICSWQQCNEWSDDENTINVHLICHSHDDMGWLKTVDQYYYGSANDVTAGGVQYILNTIVDELKKNKTRRFNWSESGFLWRWYQDHDLSQRNNLRLAVQEGQLEVVGGGWVQNDEAVAHYADIIDQMTLGLRWLNETFGSCAVPRVAWQIDAFGHSREMANIFSMMGYEALFFARINYLERAARIKSNSLEFKWSTSNDSTNSLYTEGFFEGHYGPPAGFCFDALCKDEPIMDNRNMQDFNADRRVNTLITYARQQRKHSSTNHIMFMMGGDFGYTNANMWYTNLDKIINLVNDKEFNKTEQKVKIFYSTPSCYIDAVRQRVPKLSEKVNDLLPYASSNHSYWTGFYTSRSTFKAMVRETSALYQLVKRFVALSGLSSLKLNLLAQSLALAQHHDAITGTAKENVTKDYRCRLSKGIDQGEAVLNEVLSHMAQRTKSYGHTPPKVFCRLINESICDVPRNAQNFTITILSAKSQPYQAVVRVPFYRKCASVYDQNGKSLQSQINSIFGYPRATANTISAPYELLIPIELPAFGFITIFVSSKNKRSDSRELCVNNIVKNFFSKSLSYSGSNKTEIPRQSIRNKFIKLEFDTKGYLSSLTNLDDSKTFKLRQEFLIYHGAGPENTVNQPSGAYIFRPNGTQAYPLNSNITLKIIQGYIVNEARQLISPWVTQIIRLYENKPYVEFEWMVGPIPAEDENPTTKEIITRFSSSIESNGQFFTDANGRQVIPRRRDGSISEPIAGNYYPITTSISIHDQYTQLTVLTDRSQGGSSLRDGEIELMIHRRSFYDDHWGVGEALNETDAEGRGIVAKGRHWLLFSESKRGARLSRLFASELYYSPILMFAPQQMSFEKYRSSFTTQYSALRKSLPANINLLTIEEVSEKIILLRIEHIFHSNEDEKLSKPATIEITDLFGAFSIKSVQELALGANKKIKQNKGKLGNQARIEIEIQPMEIKTFLLEVERNYIRGDLLPFQNLLRFI